jgi:hypothetical protein
MTVEVVVYKKRPTVTCTVVFNTKLSSVKCDWAGRSAHGATKTK